MKCTKCKIDKPEDRFGKDKYTKSGITHQCKECRFKSSKKWRLAHLDQERKRSRLYMQNLRATNPDKVKKQKRKSEYKMERLRPELRAKRNIRRRMIALIKKENRSERTMEIVGCSAEQLRDHLSSQFTEGMTWENYGKWHIDHIKACSKFDLTNPSEQHKCFHYTNLQPLWAADNIRKGAK